MVVTYKCPGCGAAMEYDPESGMVVCPQCGTQMSVDELERRQAEMGTTPGEGTEEDDGEDEYDEEPLGEDTYRKADNEEQYDRTVRMKVYHCPSCGAELMTDENTAAVICSFCGNPGLIADRMTGVKAPKSIIPFSVSKDQAKEKFRAWAKKQRMAPGDFSSESTMEKITGIYVPYWLYDYHVNVALRANTTRTRVIRRGDIEYVYTDHFRVYRDMDVDFQRVPVDASYRMPDDMMEALEPFDYNGLKPFDMGYIPGYLAEKYNADSDELQGRARDRAKDAAVGVARSTIQGYATVNIVDQKVDFVEQNADYAMLPVWVLNYRYHGQNFNYTMNGQTGKLTGKLPIGRGKVVKYMVIITAIVFVILSIIAMLGVM